MLGHWSRDKINDFIGALLRRLYERVSLTRGVLRLVRRLEEAPHKQQLPRYIIGTKMSQI